MTPHGIPNGGVELGGPKFAAVHRLVMPLGAVLDIREGPAPGGNSPAHALLIDLPAGTAYVVPLDLAGARRLHAGLGRLIDQLQAPSTETPRHGGEKGRST